jgi:peptide/nickel transport system substrate-binding protein
MSDSRSRRSAYRVSRRRFLRDATLTSLGVWAAACAPGTTPPGAQGQKGGEFHGAWPYDLPPKGHWNQFATGRILQGSIYVDLFYPSLAMYRWAEGNWTPWLAESFKLTGNTYEVKLRSGLKWSDGQAFTSKDVVTTFTVSRTEAQTAIWNYIDRVEAVDERTVRFNYNRPSSVGERAILRHPIYPDSQYGALAKKVSDLFTGGKTPSTDERAAVRKEISDYRPSAPLAIGPYKIDAGIITEAQLSMTRHEDGLFGKDVNFDKVVIYQGETAAVTPLVLAGDVDYATHGFPLATDRQFSAQGVRVVRTPAYTGPAIYFHWEKAAPFQDKRLRWAVAHAINKDESGRVAYGESFRAVKFNAGFSDNLVPLWVSEADQRRLKAYEFDLGKAEGFMKEAGYSKGSDGIWQKDGRKLEYELYFPSDFADWSASADHAQKALNAFGIKITPRGAIRSQQLADVNAGNFQIAFMGWGIGNPHPQGSYIQGLRTHNTTPPGGGMKYPLKQGAVDFDALINDMGEGFDTNRQKDPVTRAALAFNDLLPVVPLWERYGNNPVNDKRRVTGWPADNDPIYKNAFGTDSWVIILITEGKLRKIG